MSTALTAVRTSALKRGLALAMGLSIVLLSAEPAAAPPPSDAQIEKELERGTKLMTEGKPSEAFDVFEAAYRDLGHSLFLVNAGYAAEQAQDLPKAVEFYEAFLKKVPFDGDAAQIRKKISLMKSAVDAVPSFSSTSLRTIVRTDSDPPGAPVSVYRRESPDAAPFTGAQPSPGWERVGDKSFNAPWAFFLRAGHYVIVMEAFQDYKACSIEVDVTTNHIYQLKAVLSQGSFLAFLRVVSPVEGAKIYVNEPGSSSVAVWGRTPFSGHIAAASHTIRVEAPGYEPFQQTVKLSHGENVDVRAELQRLPYGNLRLDSYMSYFSVSVDGGPPGNYDWRKGPFKVQLPGGLHRLTLKAEGKKEYKGFVDVPRGQMLDVHVKFEDEMSYQAPIALSVLAVGAAVGTGFASAYAGYYGDQATQCKADLLAGKCSQNKLKEFDSMNSNLTVATVFGTIGTGVLAVGAALLFFDWGPDTTLSLEKPKEFDAEEPKKPRLTGALLPFVGTDGGGVVLRGMF